MAYSLYISLVFFTRACFSHAAHTKSNERVPNKRVDDSLLERILQSSQANRGRYSTGVRFNSTSLPTFKSGPLPKFDVSHLLDRRSQYDREVGVDTHGGGGGDGGGREATIESKVAKPKRHSKTILALIHSSEVPWPFRVEVLANALVTLEGSMFHNGDIGSGHEKVAKGFELVVVLDSTGEVRRKHECRERQVTMVRTQPKPSGGEVCDSVQLLQAAGIAHVVAEWAVVPTTTTTETKRPKRHKHKDNGAQTNGEAIVPARRRLREMGEKIQGEEREEDVKDERGSPVQHSLQRERGYGHGIHPAASARQPNLKATFSSDRGTEDRGGKRNAGQKNNGKHGKSQNGGGAWPWSAYRPLWFAAVEAARERGATALVVLVSSSLIPQSTISSLASAAVHLSLPPSSSGVVDGSGSVGSSRDGGSSSDRGYAVAVAPVFDTHAIRTIIATDRRNGGKATASLKTQQQQQQHLPPRRRPKLHLTVGSHPEETATHWSEELVDDYDEDEHGRPTSASLSSSLLFKQYAEHPLNYQRFADSLTEANEHASMSMHAHASSKSATTSANFGVPRRVKLALDDIDGGKHDAQTTFGAAAHTNDVHAHATGASNGDDEGFVHGDKDADEIGGSWWCDHASALMLAAAMPMESWTRLEVRPGEIWLDDCAVLKQALLPSASDSTVRSDGGSVHVGADVSGNDSAGGLFVHHGAYLVARSPDQAWNLLSNEPPPSPTAATANEHGTSGTVSVDNTVVDAFPTSQDNLLKAGIGDKGPGEKKKERGGALREGRSSAATSTKRQETTTTLVTFTCAGVWPRTLTALLGLEASAAAIASLSKGSAKNLYSNSALAEAAETAAVGTKKSLVSSSSSSSSRPRKVAAAAGKGQESQSRIHRAERHRGLLVKSLKEGEGKDTADHREHGHHHHGHHQLKKNKDRGHEQEQEVTVEERQEKEGSQQQQQQQQQKEEVQQRGGGEKEKRRGKEHSSSFSPSSSSSSTVSRASSSSSSSSSPPSSSQFPSSSFDVMLAVTPRDDDTTAAYARAAGIPVLVQPVARGLTDLWNLVLQHCMSHGYDHCFIANNDVLVTPLTVGLMSTALINGHTAASKSGGVGIRGGSAVDIVVPVTRRGAGTVDVKLYDPGYIPGQVLDAAQAEAMMTMATAADTTTVPMMTAHNHLNRTIGSWGQQQQLNKSPLTKEEGLRQGLWLDSPLSFLRIQLALAPPSLVLSPPPLQTTPQQHRREERQGKRKLLGARAKRNKEALAGESGQSDGRVILEPIKGWMAFFFGMRTDWVRENLLADGSQRLWNDTRWKNYAQEKNLPPGARLGALRNAYVHHFRGGTLDSASCKNGWLDCAVWQQDHRPDMESQWWTAKTDGLE